MVCTSGLMCGLTTCWLQNCQGAAWARISLGAAGGSAVVMGQSLAARDCPTPNKEQGSHRDRPIPEYWAPLWEQGQAKAGTEHWPTGQGQCENLVLVCLELQEISVGLALKILTLD